MSPLVAILLGFGLCFVACIAIGAACAWLGSRDLARLDREDRL